MPDNGELTVSPKGRLHRLQYLLAEATAAWRLERQWRRKPAVPAAQGEKPLLISLTSYPKRYDRLASTIRSLLSQTVKAKHVVLWVAHADADALPADVRALEAHGLDIRAVEDQRVHLKYLGAFREFADHRILLCDDDIYYWPTWAAELVAASERHPGTICCHRAHGVMLDADRQASRYDDWLEEIDGPVEGPRVFGTGVGGTLYPPGSVDPRVTDIETARSLCPSADDIWLYWMARLAGTSFRQIGPRRHFVTWPGTQDNALWQVNRGTSGGNDRQIAAMTAHFGGDIFQ